MGEGNCESKIVSRQWGDNFYPETSRCLAGPHATARGHRTKPRLCKSGFLKRALAQTRPRAWYHPGPPSLAFLDFLAFFLAFDFPCFFGASFPFFSKDFRGSATRKTLAFLVGFPSLNHFFSRKLGTYTGVLQEELRGPEKSREN